MLDVGSSELLMIVIVAIVVIGPKDLPRALYKLGQVLGKARAMSRHFRSGIEHPDEAPVDALPPPETLDEPPHAADDGFADVPTEKPVAGSSM